MKNKKEIESALRLVMAALNEKYPGGQIIIHTENGFSLYDEQGTIVLEEEQSESVIADELTK